jgi:hypothetical protein
MSSAAQKIGWPHTLEAASAVACRRNELLGNTVH